LAHEPFFWNQISTGLPLATWAEWALSVAANLFAASTVPPSWSGLMFNASHSGECSSAIASLKKRATEPP
jgi:hypothetical protein